MQAVVNPSKTNSRKGDFRSDPIFTVDSKPGILLKKAILDKSDIKNNNLIRGYLRKSAIHLVSFLLFGLYDG